MTKVHKNLRTIAYQSQKRILVMESVPQLRTIKVKCPQYVDKCCHWERRTFYLAFPYMQFYLLRHSLYLSFSKTPVQDLKEDDVSFPFLPNVYCSRLRVCLDIEAMFYHDGKFHHPNEQIMERVVEKFWDSRFFLCVSWAGLWLVPDGIRKHDLIPIRAIGSKQDKNIFFGQATEQFKAWEEGSRKDGVDFITNLDWPHTFKNFPAILEGDEKSFRNLLPPFHERDHSTLPCLKSTKTCAPFI